MSDLEHIQKPGHFYGTRAEASVFLRSLFTGQVPAQGSWSVTSRKVITAMTPQWRALAQKTYYASGIIPVHDRLAAYGLLLDECLVLLSRTQARLPHVFFFLESMLSFDPLFEQSVICLLQAEKHPKPAFVKPFCLLVESLGVSNSRRSFETLVELVGSKETRIARSAAVSLGNWRGKEVTDCIMLLLNTVTSDQVITRLQLRLRENGIDFDIPL